MSRVIKIALSFVASVILGSLLVSIFATHLNLAEVAGFGLPVSFSDRLAATAHDVVGLTPQLPIVITLSYLTAFIVAEACHRFFGGIRIYWYLLAGFSSFPSALLLIAWAVGGMMLAPARTTSGMFIMALCSTAGGWLFAHLSARKVV